MEEEPTSSLKRLEPEAQTHINNGSLSVRRRNKTVESVYQSTPVEYRIYLQYRS